MIDWQEEKENFDRTMNKAERFVRAMFIIVVLIALALLGGGVYTIYRVLLHFGVF